MSKFWNKIYPIIILLSILVSFLLIRCSPQQRLNHLVEKHPELAKQDTSTLQRGIQEPGFKKDTSTLARVDQNNYADLLQTISGLCIHLDSLQKRKLIQVVNKIEGTCLKEPFQVNFPGGGYCKIWQQSGRFYSHVEMPAKKYQIKVPFVTLTVKPEIHHSWNWFIAGIFAGILFMSLLVFLIGKYYLKNDKTHGITG